MLSINVDEDGEKQQLFILTFIRGGQYCQPMLINVISVHRKKFQVCNPNLCFLFSRNQTSLSLPKCRQVPICIALLFIRQNKNCSLGFVLCIMKGEKSRIEVWYIDRHHGFESLIYLVQRFQKPRALRGLDIEADYGLDFSLLSLPGFGD